MEAIGDANEMTNEPKKISAIIRDCSDGSLDETFTQEWFRRVEASHKSAEELLEAVKV